MRLTPALVLVVLAAAGCSSSTKPAAQASTPPKTSATTTTNPNTFECAAITHAYTVWQEDNSTALSYKEAADAEKTLENAVTGFSDKPSLSMAVAVTKLGFDANLANVSEGFGNSPDPSTVQAVEDDAASISSAYQTFLSSTCS